MNLAEIFSQAPEVINHKELLSKGELQDFTVYQEQKKIETVVAQNETTYGECDIMYSYDIEGDTHEKDSYSR